MIGGGDVQVVHVQQQAAAGAPHQRRQEGGLGHRRMVEGDIGRGVLHQDAPAEHVLHLRDMVGDVRERSLGIGQRQQVVQELAAMARPGEMLADQPGLVAFDEGLQAAQMIRVQRCRAADRQPDPVQRERIGLPDGLQIAVRRPARAHVVLGMDLEPADVGPVGQDSVVVPGLQADAGAGGNGGRAAHRGRPSQSDPHTGRVRDAYGPRTGSRDG